MGRRDHPSLIGPARRRAMRIMRAERLAGAAAPSAGIACAYLTLGLFGLGGPWAFAVCVGVAGLALAVGVWRCRWPDPALIDRRIEAAGGLAHRPLASLADVPATDTAFGAALFLAHQRRAQAAIAAARPVQPAFGAPRHDPLALRALLLLLLLVAAVSAGPAASGRLATAFSLPAWPFPGPQLDVWITPPDYANAAPFALASGGAASALAGSQLTVLVNGPRRLPRLGYPGTSFTRTGLGPTSHRADATLAGSGRLTIGPWWHRLGSDRVTVTPAAAPAIALRRLDIASDGRIDLGWHVDDRYGLTSLTAQIAPRDAPGAPSQDFALPAGTGDGASRLDLDADPLAGLPSQLTLTAVNRAGVVTRLTPDPFFTPPPPDLRDATARRLFALRQRLALAPVQAPAIGAALRRLAAAPPSTIAAGVDVEMAVLAAALARRDVTADAGVRRLFLLIRQIEAGPDDQPAQVLAAADSALLRALQSGDPSAAELQSLLQAVHQALARHLAALALPGATALGRRLDLSALDRLAEQIAADQAAGRASQAALELRNLQAALAALQSARPMSAAEAARDDAAATAAQALANLTLGQASLRDDTSNGIATPGDQAALAGALAATRHGLDQAGFAIPGLGPAAQAMAAAGAALRRNDIPAALAAQGTAIRNLQKAAAALDAARQNEASAGQDGGPAPIGANGPPDEDSAGFGMPPPNPADAIQQQIIEDDAAPNLPAPTHDYLRRLLTP